MVLASLMSALRRFGGSGVAGRRARLCLEELGGRILPATYLWAGAGAATDWGQTNWREENAQDPKAEWKYATTTPGANDDVIFAANYRTQGGYVYQFNSNCVINAPVTVHSITFKNGYTGELTLKGTLTLSGMDRTSQINILSAATISGVGAEAGNAQINLTAPAVFVWRAGTLQQVTINVQQTATRSASMDIDRNSGNVPLSRTMAGTTINVYGILNWFSGDVQDSQWPSQIHIYPGGAFYIQSNASNYTFGQPTAGAAADPKLLSIYNEGTVSVQGAAFVAPSKFIANYTTKDTTILGAAGSIGSLDIQGKAEQIGGSFQLYNSSTITTSDLFIRDGTIIGTGTVSGNLVLGYAATDNMPNTTPIISPGGGVQLGVINVTGNFNMYSGKMDIEINGDGDNNYDKISVGGNFDLTGGRADATLGLFGNILPVHFEIGANIQFPFLQYTKLIGDFNSKQVSAPGWTIGSTVNAAPTKSIYWFQSPNMVTDANLAKVGGILWQGANALANVFVPGVDTLLAGVGVNLFAADGTTLIASTTTDANGHYEFDNLNPGPYVIKFDRATQERFVQLGGQSLADPSTGMVSVDVSDDPTNINASYYSDGTPTAANDSYNAHLDTSITGNVLTNDSDPEGDTLTASLVSGPQNGTLILNPNGTFVYTPNSGFSGQDSFIYKASDGFGGTATATVTITVASTSAPTSASVDYTTPYTLDTTAADGVLAGESDPSGESLTAVLADGPANGTLTLNADGSFVYTPNDNFVGTDSFRFYSNDAGGPGNLTTVNIQVTDHPPVANTASPSTTQDTSLTINVLTNDTDPDTGDTLTVIGVSNGVYGTTSLNADGTITYSPPVGWSGTDTFSYVISDSSGRLAESTVTVTVNQAAGAPIVTQGSISTSENNAVSIDLRTLVTRSQSSANSLTYTLGNATNGTVALAADGYTATFTPAAGYYGPASFSFLVTDPANGIKTANSVAVNVLPVAANVSASTNENSSVTISVPNNASPDGDTLTVLATSNGANGTVGVNADGTITYAPPSNWYGTASFSYWAVDAYGDIAEGTVSVTVNPLPPTASPGSLTTQQGMSVSIDLSSLASDVNMPSANLTYSVSSQNGTVSLSADGHTAQFVPANGFTGQTQFSYTVTDPTTGLSASSTVTVTVNGSGGTGNSPPVAKSYMTPASPSPITISIQSLASDSNGYPLTIISVTPPMAGIVSIASDGQSVTYTGPYPLTSTVYFTYTVSDGHGGTATGTIAIYP